MPTPPDSEISSSAPRPKSRPVDLPRRRLGVGLGVSAVFTLASRPVLAGQCMSASSAASGNLSVHGPALTCTGLTPAQWVDRAQNANPMDPNNPTQNGFPGGNVQFHAVSLFVSGSLADWGPSARLYEVMADEDSPTGTGNTNKRGGFLASTAESNTAATSSAPNPANPISMEFAATLLNIRDGRIPSGVLTETGLIGMWNEWMDTGMYAPMAGTTWNADQIVAYLRTLQGA